MRLLWVSAPDPCSLLLAIRDCICAVPMRWALERCVYMIHRASSLAFLCLLYFCFGSALHPVPDVERVAFETVLKLQTAKRPSPTA